MMRSAIDWLMGKSDSSFTNELNPIPTNNGPELESPHNDKDAARENSLCNGHFNEGVYSKSTFSRPINEEIRSPWGRTLTPKSPKCISHLSQNASPSRINSNSGISKRLSPSASWEDMSFASDVMSPGFASRIAKEARVGRKPYDGSRKYPIGQEKYIRAGILPNVRLKGRSKPVVMSRRAPTSPLLPLASQSSPFSSSSLASGFLASATTRMPDISSVVSVLDSTPASSACDSIKDPTSVQAVVAALEQAQNLKSGIKRSRYGDSEDSSKKQKCTLNSTIETLNDFTTPVISQAFNNGTGGEKRALDLSPPSSGENSLGVSPSIDHPQLSPENKRRCIPDPRIASFSSSKNIASNSFNLQSSGGRETPFFFYESHRDSDSESNKSLESHHSRQSDRSFRAQNHDPSGGRTSSSNQDHYDRSGSQTPQSLRGSYGLGGITNGSSNSSRTTTPSRPSHVFTLEAYKADKAKSHQRLNKMLSMLFNNTSDEEADLSNQSPGASFNSVVTTTSNSAALPAVAPPVISLSSSPSDLSAAISSPITSSVAIQSGLLKEAIDKTEASISVEQKNTETDSHTTPELSNGAADVSASYTVILKQNKSGETSVIAKSDENETTSSEDASVNKDNSQVSNSKQSFQPTSFQLPSYQESVEASSKNTLPALSSSPSLGNISTTVLPSTCSTSNASPLCTSTLIASFFKEKAQPIDGKETSSASSIVTSSTESKVAHATSLQFPTFVSSTSASIATSSNPLEALKNTTDSISKPSTFNFGSPLTTVSESMFSFGKPPPVSSGTTSIAVSKSPNNFSGPVVSAKENAAPNGSNFASLQNSEHKSDQKNIMPSFGIFSPTSTSTGSSLKAEPPTTSSGLFTFPMATTSANVAPVTTTSPFDLKEKQSTTNETKPPQFSSPFTFGASIPSNTSETTTHTSTSNISASNLFTFGETKPQTSVSSTSSTAVTSMGLPSNAGSKPMHSSVSAGFTFNPTPSSVSSTTSASLFGNANNPISSNVFNVGSPSFMVPSQPPSTSVISNTATSAATFTFGNSSKAPTHNNTPQFNFAALTSTTSATTQSTSIVNATTGGGFSFSGTDPLKASALTTTTTSSTFPTFGVTTNTTTAGSNIFSFGTPGPPKQASGFSFPTAATKASTSTANSSVFTFGSTTTAQPSSSLFGTNLAVTSASGVGFGGISNTKPVSTTFNFGSGGSEKPSFPTFDSAQSPPKLLFGGDTNANPPSLFGSSSNTAALSHFGGASEQNQNPFGAKSPTATSPTPTFGGFSASKPGPNPGLPSTQNIFQMNQNSSQSSTAFTFGQAPQPTAPPQSNVFLFGSQGSQPSAAPSAPAFGSSTFNFGSSNMAPNPSNNIFTVGVSSEAPSAPRRPKARAHHRRK